MSNNKTNNGCTACRYFLQHYYFDENMKLRAASCGKCLKHNILKKDYTRFPFPNGCEEWEEQSSPLQKYKRVVEYAVERMENEFSELKAILKIAP